MQEMEQNDLESELAHDRRRGQPSLAEQLTTLSSDEDQRIQDLLFDLDCEAVLVSVRRTCTEIKYEGMIFRNIPIVRFIIRLEGAVPKGDSSITAAETNKSEIKQQETNKKEDTIDASQEKTKEASGSGKVSGEPIESGSSEGNKDSPRFDRGRPTYIRVHRKHLSPETLNDYHLPWEWDFVSTSLPCVRVRLRVCVFDGGKLTPFVTELIFDCIFHSSAPTTSSSSNGSQSQIKISYSNILESCGSEDSTILIIHGRGVKGINQRLLAGQSRRPSNRWLCRM